jgi:hypothetical protein
VLKIKEMAKLGKINLSQASVFRPPPLSFLANICHFQLEPHIQSAIFSSFSLGGPILVQKELHMNVCFTGLLILYVVTLICQKYVDLSNRAAQGISKKQSFWPLIR